jgi:hypothetical protein
VNKSKKILKLLIKDLTKDTIIDEDIYYTYNDLKDSTKKLDNLLVVTAETKTIRKNEHFHFTNANIYLGFSFSKFIKLINEGYIQFDMRIGIYRTGASIGETHDHGNGFRVHRDKMSDLFKQTIVI